MLYSKYACINKYTVYNIYAYVYVYICMIFMYVHKHICK